MKIKNQDILIVGGGFRGIIISDFLKKENTIDLIESSNFVGGVLYSEEWNGFYIDKGIHIFANIDDQFTKLIQKILKNKFTIPNVKGGSRINEITSKYVPVPDLLTLSEKKQEKIQQELILCSLKLNKSQNLQDFILSQYGKTAGKYYIQLAKKLFAIDPKKISSDSNKFTPISRGRFFHDELTKLLKQVKIFDEKLALPNFHETSAQKQIKGKKYRYFYPTEKGLRGFCDGALEYLKNKKVNVKINTKIESLEVKSKKISCTFSNGVIKEYDRVIWTINPLKIFKILKTSEKIQDSGLHEVPMVVFYYVVDLKNINDFTYIQDYTSELLPYRAAVTGLLGNQIINNQTYIDVEIPTKIGSELWNEPEKFYERVWNDTVKMGLVKGKLPNKKKVIKTPISFRAAKVNYEKQNKKIINEIKKISTNIILVEQKNSQLTQIVQSIKKQFDKY